MSSNISTYPRPTSSSKHTTRISPVRPFLPLQQPPSSTPPSLPLRPSLSPLPDPWTRTSHVIPAAYLRTYPSSTGNLSRSAHPFRKTPAKEGESKEERNERAAGEVAIALERSYEAIQAEDEDVRVEGEQKGLWIAGERWLRSSGDEEGVTIICTHANGFTKESWIPTLRRLIDLGPTSNTSTFGNSPTSEGISGITIDEIWLLDDIHHGASIELNAGLIGPVHNWVDGGRDVVNFIQHCLPSREAGTVLDWKREKKGKRKVIGLGHSVGGNALVQAAHERPDLFHALFLVEPMCPPSNIPRSSLSNPTKYWPAVHLTLKRRSTFPTRQAAEQTTSTSPFFAAWHPESKAIWNAHSLIPTNPNDKDGPTEHATPTWAEACVFAEPEGLGVGWDKLKALEIPVGFVMGNDPGWTLGQENTREMVWRARGSRNERFMDAGHLIVQEKPDELADAFWRFMGTVVSRTGGKAKL